MNLLFNFLTGHAFADFVFQTDAMAKGKNRNRQPDMSVVPPGQKYMPTWYYWLTAHALVHGSIVAAISGSTELGIVETIAHWLIDFGKCENWYGIHIDQALHMGCKLAYIWFLQGGF